MRHEDQTEFYTCPICGAGIDNDVDGIVEHNCPDEEAYVNYYKPKDIVYILGSGSRWDDNELRYSLRSLKHFKHDKVIIVGERPKWLQNVIHIDVKDNFANIHGGKFKNVVKKIEAAAKDPRVSDHFVLMNDDFFFLKDTDGIEPRTNGTLKEQLATYLDKRRNDQYYNLLLRTQRFLNKKGIEEPVSYAIHYPFVFEKQKFLDIIEEIDWFEKPCSWRTLYGNLYDVGSVPSEDPKISNEAQWHENVHKGDSWDFLSISDNVAILPAFQEWIKARLPEESIYENNN